MKSFSYSIMIPGKIKPVQFTESSQKLLALPIDECQNKCYSTNRTREQRKRKAGADRIPGSKEPAFHRTAPEDSKVQMQKGDMTYDDAQYFQR